MDFKDEFFNLLAQTFSSDEIEEVGKITDKSEAEIISKYPPDSHQSRIKALYYDLCALYYSTAKDYRNFMCNLANRFLPQHMVDRFNEEDEQERRKLKYYNEVLDIIREYIAEEAELFNKVLDKQKLAYALTNAIFPEILAQESSKYRLSYLNGLQEMENVKNAIHNGGEITRIAINVNDRQAGLIKCCNISIEFWKDFVRYVSFRQEHVKDLEKELDLCKQQVVNSTKRIALRICMVFVSFGVLKKTTPSDRHCLKNDTGEYVSLEQGIMAKVYNLLVKNLNITLREQEDEYGIVEGSKNTKPLADKVKNLLRKGKKGSFDDFSYSDINDSLWGCFGFGKYTQSKSPSGQPNVAPAANPVKP